MNRLLQLPYREEFREKIATTFTRCDKQVSSECDRFAVSLDKLRADDPLIRFYGGGMKSLSGDQPRQSSDGLRRELVVE